MFYLTSCEVWINSNYVSEIGKETNGTRTIYFVRMLTNNYYEITEKEAATLINIIN